ncbi:type II secretion system protein N [Uliginosibacterium gangwonense]|uniref:type II secretion system protein N n=1 Tax=Uliginosibacterium gangwonense TaxID=392736 RepID=UPI00037C6992|nr:type II secretion system protein N [Uliginosibacterium gangwonense]
MSLLRTYIVRLQTALAPALAWLCVMAVCGWLAAGWFWRLNAPPMSGAIFAPMADPINAANEVSSRHLFGLGTQANKPQGEAAVVAPGLRIIGILTGSIHGPGFAVVQEQGQASRPVIEGEELASGIRLSKVLPQGVEILRDGVKETLALSGNQNEAVPPAPTTMMTQMPPPGIQQPAAPPVVMPSPTPPPVKGLAGIHTEAKSSEQPAND